MGGGTGARVDGREAILWGLVVAVVSPTLSPALNNIAPPPTYPPYHFPPPPLAILPLASLSLPR